MSVPESITAARQPNTTPRRTVARAADWLAHMHTEGEEWVNGWTHAAGCLLGLLGGVVLLRSASHDGLTWYFASCVVYCASLIGVYAASTLSHWVREPTWRYRFRAWDQGLIFLLIVGTFTPLSAAYLSGWWHAFTAALWLLGLVGFVSKVAHAHCVDKIVLWLYLALGWLPILGWPALWYAAPAQVSVLVLLGGVAYTAGSALLMNDQRGRYMHAAWHLCVIVGSTCHFFAIYGYSG